MFNISRHNDVALTLPAYIKKNNANTFLPVPTQQINRWAPFAGLQYG